MYSKCIFQKNLDQNTLFEIIKVKSIAWPYAYDKQFKWIEDNIDDNDIHFLLYNESHQLVAYLNLIAIDFLINEEANTGYGVGNVCALEKGMGYGSFLMYELQKYLFNENVISILFCKDQLVSFYEKFDWKLVPGESIVIDQLKNDVNTMTYNYRDLIKKIEYSGKLF